MIIALIRLHANIHTLQQLQSYRQSKVQIEPAAVWYWWVLTPTLNPPALSQSKGTCNQHPAGHVEQVLLMHILVRVFCLCFHYPSTISSSLCVKNDWETPAKPVSMCAPSPSAIFSSLMGTSECAHRAWRSMSLCYTWESIPGKWHWLATSSKPDFWRSLCYSLPWSLKAEAVLLHRHLSELLQKV